MGHDTGNGVKVNAKKKWIVLEEWMTNLGLTTVELVIFALVYGYANSKGSYYGSLKNTAKWASCSIITASRGLSGLVEKGYLNKKTKSGSTCVYTLNLEIIWSNRLENKLNPYQNDGGDPYQFDEGPPINLMGDTPINLMEPPINLMGDPYQNDVQYNNYISNENSSTKNIETKKDLQVQDSDFFDAQEQEEDTPPSIPTDKPIESTKDATTLWNMAREYWNEMGLKPGCREVFIKPKDAQDVLSTFQYYSWEEIKNAIGNYAWHLAQGADYKPTAPYGSLAGFLKTGVQRYFDDDDVKKQFKIKGADNAGR
jgi:hypothetical protein